MMKISDLSKFSWQCVHFALPEQFEKVAARIKTSPVTFVTCSVDSVRNDEELLAVLSRALDFPEYFGGNWDALDECLTDDSSTLRNGCVLALTNSKALWENAPYSGGRLISAWQSAAEIWGDEKVPFHLVYVL